MNSPGKDETLQPVAGLLAAILPGLGYFYLGDPRRAAAVFLSITGLFAGGLYIGGIDVVDSAEDRWWFYVQALNGPIAFGVDYVHQHKFKISTATAQGKRIAATPPPNSARSPLGAVQAYTKSLGRVNEAGTLYIAMGGMLNLIAFIDCLWHAPPRRRRDG